MNKIVTKPAPASTVDYGLRLDPKTFEILRHRLWYINDEGARTISRLSGSPVATEVFDMNTGLMTREGDLVYIDTFICAQATTLTPFVKTLLAEYADNPGIGENDTFLTNDPYVSVAHQTCVMVAGPVHWKGKLAGWTGASLHVIDVGGSTAGQAQINADSIFAEQPLISPVKLVEGGKFRRDIERVYLRNSRLPHLLALDLRAKVAAAQVVRKRLVETFTEFGFDTVQAAMADVIDYTEKRMRARLRELPDGVWKHRGYIEWGEKIYRCAVTMTKKDDSLVFDFSETDDQAPAIINCTIHGLVGAVLGAMMVYLCWEIPWSPAGVRRVVEVKSRKGSVFDAAWPAGVSKSTTTAIWEARNLASITIAKMLGASAPHRDRAMAGWQGVKALEELFGRDEAGEPFGGPLLDGMAGGTGALCCADGIDTGGHTSSVRATIANVESYEFRYPILYLYRRQTRDSGGPGMFRGGAGVSMMYVPNGVEEIPTKVLHTFGVEQPESPGMFGGHPSCTNQFAILRDSDVQERFASGEMPGELAGIEGTLEVYPGYKATSMTRRDVYRTASQGGGGYGDPIDREPNRVADDVANGLVSPEWARRAYGVVLDARGAVDKAETATTRARLREERRRACGQNAIPKAESWNPQTAAIRVSETVYCEAKAGKMQLRCRCGHVLGPANKSPKMYAAMARLPVQSIGPEVNPHEINGHRFELREFFCPSCMTRLEVEIARPEDPVLDDSCVSPDWLSRQGTAPAWTKQAKGSR
ncbi:MAG: hydantoinase B/oxoprolinase family protein [Pseudorhodoplanes sp.]